MKSRSLFVHSGVQSHRRMRGSIIDGSGVSPQRPIFEDNTTNVISIPSLDVNTTTHLAMIQQVVTSERLDQENDGVSTVSEIHAEDGGLEVLLLPLLRHQTRLGVWCREILQWRYYSW